MDRDAAPTATLVIAGVIAPADIPPLCDQLTTLLDRAAGVIVCDVAGVVEEDLATVDALARLHLQASGRGCELRILNAGATLRDLVRLSGLSAVLRLDPATR